jgi:hypothetical protein
MTNLRFTVYDKYWFFCQLLFANCQLNPETLKLLKLAQPFVPQGKLRGVPLFRRETLELLNSTLSDR